MRPIPKCFAIMTLLFAGHAAPPSAASGHFLHSVRKRKAVANHGPASFLRLFDKLERACGFDPGLQDSSPSGGRFDGPRLYRNPSSIVASFCPLFVFCCAIIGGRSMLAPLLEDCEML